MQKERGSYSSKMTFLCLISTVCGEKQAEGRGCRSQASPQPNRLCRQCWPWGAAGMSLPGHTGRDMQDLHAWTHLLPAQVPTGPWAKAATPISPAFFFFFFCWVHKAEQREAPGHAETTAHALLNLISLLPQGNIPQSCRPLPAYPCALSVCRQTGWGGGHPSALCTHRACSAPSRSWDTACCGAAAKNWDWCNRNTNGKMRVCMQVRERREVKLHSSRTKLKRCLMFIRKAATSS